MTHCAFVARFQSIFSKSKVILGEQFSNEIRVSTHFTFTEVQICQHETGTLSGRRGTHMLHVQGADQTSFVIFGDLIEHAIEKQKKGVPKRKLPLYKIQIV